MIGDDQSRTATSEFLLVVSELRKAKNVLVLTGAGVSAEKQHPDVSWTGRMVAVPNPEDLATLAAFRERSGELFGSGMTTVGRSSLTPTPDAAHRMLAAIETPQRNVFIITQNVDDFHERVGSHHMVDPYPWFDLDGHLP